ncbi:hypothetical protein JXR93_00300 [bacterium]|nr:hypothetical protein [bacterium]
MFQPEFEKEYFPRVSKDNIDYVLLKTDTPNLSEYTQLSSKDLLNLDQQMFGFESKEFQRLLYLSYNTMKHQVFIYGIERKEDYFFKMIDLLVSFGENPAEIGASISSYDSWLFNYFFNQDIKDKEITIEFLPKFPKNVFDYIIEKYSDSLFDESTSVLDKINPQKSDYFFKYLLEQNNEKYSKGVIKIITHNIANVPDRRFITEKNDYYIQYITAFKNWEDNAELIKSFFYQTLVKEKLDISFMSDIELYLNEGKESKNFEKMIKKVKNWDYLLFRDIVKKIYHSELKNIPFFINTIALTKKLCDTATMENLIDDITATVPYNRDIMELYKIELSDVFDHIVHFYSDEQFEELCKRDLDMVFKTLENSTNDSTIEKRLDYLYSIEPERTYSLILNSIPKAERGWFIETVARIMKTIDKSEKDIMQFSTSKKVIVRELVIEILVHFDNEGNIPFLQTMLSKESNKKLISSLTSYLDSKR